MEVADLGWLLVAATIVGIAAIGTTQLIDGSSGIRLLGIGFESPRVIASKTLLHDVAPLVPLLERAFGEHWRAQLVSHSFTSAGMERQSEMITRAIDAGILESNVDELHDIAARFGNVDRMLFLSAIDMKRGNKTFDPVHQEVFDRVNRLMLESAKASQYRALYVYNHYFTLYATITALGLTPLIPLLTSGERDLSIWVIISQVVLVGLMAVPIARSQEYITPLIQLLKR